LRGVIPIQLAGLSNLEVINLGEVLIP
jgi:hypothetical protein